MNFQCDHGYIMVTDRKLYTYQFLYLLVEEMSVKPSNGGIPKWNKVRFTLSVFLTLV